MIHYFYLFTLNFSLNLKEKKTENTTLYMKDFANFSYNKSNKIYFWNNKKISNTSLKAVMNTV